MYELKEIVGLITIVLGIVAYGPYIIDTIRGTTKPHIYTWSVGGLVTMLIFFLQVTGDAGAGAWVTLTVSLISLTIAALSIRQADWNITLLNTIFLASALVALALWLAIDKPTISMLLLVSVGAFGFLPTIRKTWHRPETETVSTYIINTFRHALSFAALGHYSLLTALFPATWTIINAVVAAIIIIRKNTNP